MLCAVVRLRFQEVTELWVSGLGTGKARPVTQLKSSSESMKETTSRENEDLFRGNEVVSGNESIPTVVCGWRF